MKSVHNQIWILKRIQLLQQICSQVDSIPTLVGHPRVDPVWKQVWTPVRDQIYYQVREKVQLNQ